MEVTRMLSSRFDLDLDRVTRNLPVFQVRRRRSSVLTPAIAAGAVLAGALTAFLLDPAQGRRRRHRAAQRLAGAARRVGRRTARRGRYVQGVVEGMGERAQRPKRPGVDLDDNTLADKVKSEVFGDPDVPKGAIDVNAEHGVVVLRGEVQTPQLIESIEDRVRRLEGVGDVRNLLHLPKTPARAASGSRKTR